MEFQSCPYCHTRVVLTADGTCPSCGARVADAKALPASVETSFSDNDSGFRDGPMSATGSLNPYQPPKYVSDEHNAEYARSGKQGVLWILFSIKGRIPRRVLWGASIITTLMFYAAVPLLVAIFGEDSGIGMFGVVALYLTLLWISFAITVKRWHDRNKSGWWILIGIIPIIGSIWQYVETGCLRGTIGSNRYGPDPT